MPSNQPTDFPAEDTRRRIIQAALRLFGKIGYPSSTTRAIAEAAGVNEVTLFRHFGNKKNLLMACMQTFNAASFTARFEGELTGDYRKAIRQMAKLQIEDTAANMDLLRLLVYEARNVPELREAMMAGASGNLARLSGYFQRLLDAGIVRPGFTADQLAALFDHVFSMKLFYDNQFQEHSSPQLPSDEEITHLVDFFVRGTQSER